MRIPEGKDCRKVASRSESDLGTISQSQDGSHYIFGRTCTWPDRLHLFWWTHVHRTKWCGGGPLPSSRGWDTSFHDQSSHHSTLAVSSAITTRNTSTKGSVDVIINGYATTQATPPVSCSNHRHHHHQRQQQLPPPLVLYLDDYVGNEADLLLVEMQVHDVIQEQGRHGIYRWDICEYHERVVANLDLAQN